VHWCCGAVVLRAVVLISYQGNPSLAVGLFAHFGGLLTTGGCFHW